MGTGASRDRIVGVVRVRARDVVERDADTPAIRRTPDEQPENREKQHSPQQRTRPGYTEIDDYDQRRDGNPVADDREEPCVARVALEDESAT
jgi:hypothetical protein